MTFQAFWKKYKYQLNALILIFPCWFFYQSLAPEFPPVWPASEVGQFEISPMPFNLDQPYTHDGTYVKDFLLIFNKGNISDIRQAYLNIGEQPLPLAELQQGADGILHGSRHGQHVHAIAQEQISAGHKVWLTIELWQGEQLVSNWDVPKELVKI